MSISSKGFVEEMHPNLQHIFSCRTESAAALEKNKKGEEGEGEGEVRDISNLFQNYSGNDILRISGGYLGAFLEYLEFTFYVIRGSGSF